MPKILTVDDSRAVRMIVSKQARDLGFEVEEAEDGEQGLAKLEETQIDLVILDITMPVLDGPGMLTRMRDAGKQTPVLMLTSESKRSIISQLLKMGITDYILKPFKPEELQAKILKALKMDSAPNAVRPSDTAAAGQDKPSAVSAPAAAPARGGGDSGGLQPLVDILVVDDMENVQKRLRQLLPERLSLAGALSGNAALVIAREKAFKVLLIDHDLSDVSSAGLMKQLRLLQPQAACLALALRTVNNVQDEARDAGYDGVMFKPFTGESLEDFLLKYFDNQDVLSKDDNVVKVSAFKGREARLAGFFMQIDGLVKSALDDVAAACFSEMILDLSQIPSVPDKVARLVLDLSERSTKIGVELRLVGGEDLKKVLNQLADTADVPVFPTVAEAQSGKAA